MNPTPNHLARAEALLEPWLARTERPTDNRLDIWLSPDAVLPVVATLVAGEWGYLAAITGLDPGVATGQLHVLYHFAEGAAVVTLRVAVPRDVAELPTIRPLIPLAAMYEQELTEVLGVAVVGAPLRGRLFLPDDWPDGVYPLRKEFQMEQLERESEPQ
ncbi:MAG: NADH-quinone oxidoreductase subunit C [Candidatus Promineofilum sp.]|nr:NADH-quinone oxidoreductase subunit C [Promineifilum sp.]